MEYFSVKIEGDTPLIPGNCSACLSETGDRHRRTPWMDFCDSLYWISQKPESPIDSDVEEAHFGIPTQRLKRVAIEAGYVRGIVPNRAKTRASFTIIEHSAEIMGKPQIRDDLCRIGRSPVFHRCWGEFPEWSMKFTVKYNPEAITKELIMRLLKLAGSEYGIGAWTPERDGDFGAFHVVAAE